MNEIGTVIYLVGAGLTYLLAIDILNVRVHLRRWVALAIAAIWLPLLITALLFLSADAIELAWRRWRVPSRRGDRL